ncbi:MAG TPA: DNA recombination/repair protein RecA, partial [Polyangiaceae bacterium]|nr:DNA recombination/repair protein RecA [Polyangiaceae bacterium]
NKMAPPFREVEFDILYGQGISRSGDVLDLASEIGIVEKSGSWFSFESDRIGQGRENARTYLEQHPDVMDRIEAMVLAKHNIRRAGANANNSATAPAPAPEPKATAPEKTNGDGKKVPHIAVKPAN